MSAAVEMPTRAPAELAPEELAPLVRLAEVLAEQRPLADAAAAFAPVVTMHADDYIMQSGAEGWIRWVAFMRAHSRLEGLYGEFEGFRRDAGGTIVGTGRWYGSREGQDLRSGPVSARYRVVDGKIVELWSRRANYTLILGEGFDTSLGFWLTIARFGAWSVLNRK